MSIAVLEILRLLIDLDAALFQMILKICGHSQVSIAVRQHNILRFRSDVTLGDIDLGNRVKDGTSGSHVIDIQPVELRHTIRIGLGGNGVFRAAVLPGELELLVGNLPIFRRFVDLDAAGRNVFWHINVRIRIEREHLRIQVITGRRTDFLDVIHTVRQRYRTRAVLADRDLTDLIFTSRIDINTIHCLRPING